MNEAAPPKPAAADGAPDAPAQDPSGERQGAEPRPRKRARRPSERPQSDRPEGDRPADDHAEGARPKSDTPPRASRVRATQRVDRATADEPEGTSPSSADDGGPANEETSGARKRRERRANKRKLKPRGSGEAANDDAHPRQPEGQRPVKAARGHAEETNGTSRGAHASDGARDDGRDRGRGRRERARDRDEEEADHEPVERPASLRGIGADEDEPEPAVYEVRFPDEAMDQDAVKVLLRLSQHGYQAYLVGGGVRDLLLGKSPKDFDVATSARPQDVRRIFRNCRVIGRRFRLAHVLFSGGKIIEVATFRRDHGQRIDRVPADLARRWPLVSDYEPTRLVPSASADDIRPDEDLLIVTDNVFGEPFEDAIRRDFTINGLFYDIEHEEVIDYVGGMADVERHLLRMIGDPIVRFREDPVRILRAIKFSARLDLGIAADVLDAIQAYRGELSRAAKPRILEEIFRLLRGGAAHRSFYLAWDLGVLAEILPELAGYLDDRAPDADLTWRRLSAVDARVASGETLSEAVMVSALLLGPLNEALDGARNQAAAFEWFMEEVAERIAMPRRLKDRIRLITGSQGRLRSGKLGAIQTRDFFAEAATLYAIDCVAREQPVPEWAIDPPYIAPEEEPPRRRRRRRRG
ncbi:MAG: polynucleotide adenylyltransferase PcnB [Polyangiales bacterium]|nr:polynucleotide adenylyltransferase PcnB [Myxococcales bacterium]MCB9661628.1 polynucleotide adenylyltransferase PcnB [Sandaracinaceae bacterium]